MKFHFLYETLNTVNGKIYRGKHSTSNLEDGYIGSGVAFTKAVKKYGKDAFQRQIVQYFDDEMALDAAEREWITPEFVALKTNYNLVPGGQGGAAPFSLMTEEARSKRSRAAAKTKVANMTPEWRKSHGEKSLAWQQDEELKKAAYEKHSAKMKGRTKETHDSIVRQLATRKINHAVKMSKLQDRVRDLLLNKGKSVREAVYEMSEMTSASTVYRLARKIYDETSD